MSRILQWVFVVALLRMCESYKILALFPFPSSSHGILGDGIVRHLWAAGHEVTHITSFLKKDPPPNLRQIDVSDCKEVLPNILNIRDLMEKKVQLNDQSFRFAVMANVTRRVLENNNVKKLLEDSDAVFDVVIAEWMFSEAYCGIASVFNCPFVWFFPIEHPSLALRIIDQIPNPAYTPMIYSDAVPPFSFTDRLQLLWSHAKLHITTSLSYTAEEKIYEDVFTPILAQKGLPQTPFSVMRHNISLVLVNSHESLGTALRTPPNYKNIGGYHIDPKLAPLPKDLQKIMDEAKDGVIYFSMGSNLKSKDLPDELKRGFLKMFSRFKQTIIWKFEEKLPELPKNVHILQWAPQQSLLAHPNCVLFITHGGLLSTTEAVHAGVPIIGIPVFSDQFLNINKAVAKGFAKRVDLSFTMIDTLKLAIEDVLYNPRYTEKARELSMIYHDRPVSPGAELVHWVEHVVRTRGAPHLRSPALDMAFYQKMYLDLAAIVVAALFVSLLIIKKVFKSNKKVSKKKRN